MVLFLCGCSCNCILHQRSFAFVSRIIKLKNFYLYNHKDILDEQITYKLA